MPDQKKKKKKKKKRRPGIDDIEKHTENPKKRKKLKDGLDRVARRTKRKRRRNERDTGAGTESETKKPQTGPASSTGLDTPGTNQQTNQIKTVRTANGAEIKSNPHKTTTVLGRFRPDMDQIINKELKIPKNEDFGPKKGDFNALNVPDERYQNPEQFWNEVNKPFLDEAIKRGDDIVFASDPMKKENMVRPDGKPTGFGREYQYLLSNGYKYDQERKMMIKEGGETI